MSIWHFLRWRNHDFKHTLALYVICILWVSIGIKDFFDCIEMLCIVVTRDGHQRKNFKCCSFIFILSTKNKYTISVVWFLSKNYKILHLQCFPEKVRSILFTNIVFYRKNGHNEGSICVSLSCIINVVKLLLCFLLNYPEISGLFYGKLSAG